MQTTLTKSKEQLLYNTVYNEIMDARLKIYKMKDGKNISIDEIDEILYALSHSAPDKAVGCFKKKPNKI